MSANFPELEAGSSDYKKIYGEVKRTFNGVNYKSGVTKGYINMIRKVYADNAGNEFEMLPEKVYSW